MVPLLGNAVLIAERERVEMSLRGGTQGEPSVAGAAVELIQESGDIGLVGRQSSTEGGVLAVAYDPNGGEPLLETHNTAQFTVYQGLPRNSVLFETSSDSNAPKDDAQQDSDALPATAENQHVETNVRPAHLSPLPWSKSPSTPQSTSHGESGPGVTTPNGDAPTPVGDAETALPVINASTEIDAGAEMDLMMDDVISVAVPFESSTNGHVWENTNMYLEEPMRWWELCDGGVYLGDYAAECPPLDYARSPYGRIPLPALFMLDGGDNN